MSDHETLLRWLSTAAARISWDRRLQELGRFACALVVVGLFAQVLDVFGIPAPVGTVLDYLLVISALAVVVLFAWRLARATTLAQAAGAADTRANLKDELKSARWFGQFSMRDAFVELLLTRAARTAQALDARRLFPLAIPKSMLTAIALGILTAALAWFSPRVALPVMQARIPGPDSSAVTAGEKQAEELAGHSTFPIAAKEDVLMAAWLQLEGLTKELPASAENGAIQRAVAARDAGLAAQLLKATKRNREAAAASRKLSARPRP